MRGTDTSTMRRPLFAVSSFIDGMWRTRGFVRLADARSFAHSETARIRAVLSVHRVNTDLSTESDYATCDHCVIATEDDDPVNGPAAFYFQASGTMTIETPDTGLDGSSKGSLVGVKLVEVDIDFMTGKSTPVPNGRCLLLDTKWDTTAVSTFKGACDVTVGMGDDSCAKGAACMPVTGGGCMPGDACDFTPGANPQLSCLPLGMTVPKLCEACHPSAGPYCDSGMSCMGAKGAAPGKCVKYCCSNTDCGGAHTCDKTQGTPAGVGVCAE